MNKGNNNPSIDPQVIALLEVLRVTPERDPQAVTSGRANFETELDACFAAPGAISDSNMGLWTVINHKVKGTFQMMTLRHRFVLITIAALLAVAVVLFGGASATVSAAQSALPGDALYPVKTSWEQTQASMSGNAYHQTQMFLEFAERRLDEIAALIEEGRFDDIAIAVNEFELYIQKAIESSGVVTTSDPQQARELTMMITQALSRYAHMLTAMLAQVPDNALGDMQRAIIASQEAYRLGHREEVEFVGIVEAITDESWTVAGHVVNIAPWTQIEGSPEVGDYVKVHAYVDEDGVLTAREIEPEGMDGDDDDNSNANHNGNDNEGEDNGNSNSNFNGDDDDHGDGNMNSNDNDDHGNENSNDNDDDGDHDNGNMNSNDHDDDDEGNDNEDEKGNEDRNDKP